MLLFKQALLNSQLPGSTRLCWDCPPLPASFHFEVLRGRWIFSSPTVTILFWKAALSSTSSPPGQLLAVSFREIFLLRLLLHFFLLTSLRLVPKSTNDGSDCKIPWNTNYTNLKDNGCSLGMFPACSEHTCMVQLSHLLLNTEILATDGVPSAEASMGNQTPLGLITGSYNGQSWKGS